MRIDMLYEMHDILIKEGFEKGYKEGFEKGYKEGFEIGYKEGINETNKELIEKLSKNFSIDEIANISGFSKEEINKILFEN